jgi:hypothetical protein
MKIKYLLLSMIFLLIFLVGSISAKEIEQPKEISFDGQVGDIYNGTIFVESPDDSPSTGILVKISTGRMKDYMKQAEISFDRTSFFLEKGEDRIINFTLKANGVGGAKIDITTEATASGSQWAYRKSELNTRIFINVNENVEIKKEINNSNKTELDNSSETIIHLKSISKKENKTIFDKIINWFKNFL